MWEYAFQCSVVLQSGTFPTHSVHRGIAIFSFVRPFLGSVSSSSRGENVIPLRKMNDFSDLYNYVRGYQSDREEDGKAQSCP